MEEQMNVKDALKAINRMAEQMNDEERLKLLLKGRDVSEVINLMMKSGNIYNRRILRFFRWFCKWIPLVIMLAHWYGVYDFSQHPRPMFTLDKENTFCYLWIYFMIYILPMVIILASRFFFLCWRYRIPFFYFFGVNAMHLCYWNIFTTNEMVKPHFCLMAMILMMYAYGFAEMFLNTKLGKRLF
jgi:glucan phosphoethanolaminetransferase (alkaline phosphatase superfamily)